MYYIVDTRKSQFLTVDFQWVDLKETEKSCKHDKEIVLTAIKGLEQVLEYVPEELKEDIEFVKEMIAVNRDTCNYIRAKVLRDIGFRKYYY